MNSTWPLFCLSFVGVLLTIAIITWSIYGDDVGEWWAALGRVDEEGEWL